MVYTIHLWWFGGWFIIVLHFTNINGIPEALLENTVRIYLYAVSYVYAFNKVLHIDIIAYSIIRLWRIFSQYVFF